MIDRKLTSEHRPRSNAVEIVVMEGRKLTSNGAGAGIWMDFALGPIFEGLAAHLESITVHLLQEHRSNANLNHRVQLVKSYDGTMWNPGVDIIASQNTIGYTISADYTTRTEFGRFFKLRLGLEDDGTPYDAEFSATICLKFWN